MVAVEHAAGWGERVGLEICADVYEQGGSLALLAVNAASTGLWCALTVNLPGDPVAAAWCSGRGRVVVDANNVPAALVCALVGAGVLELSGRSVLSGFCSYPLASVPPGVLSRMRGYRDVAGALSER